MCRVMAWRVVMIYSFWCMAVRSMVRWTVVSAGVDLSASKLCSFWNYALHGHRFIPLDLVSVVTFKHFLSLQTVHSSGFCLECRYFRYCKVPS